MYVLRKWAIIADSLKSRNHFDSNVQRLCEINNEQLLDDEQLNLCGFETKSIAQMLTKRLMMSNKSQVDCSNLIKETMEKQFEYTQNVRSTQAVFNCFYFE